MTLVLVYQFEANDQYIAISNLSRLTSKASNQVKQLITRPRLRPFRRYECESRPEVPKQRSFRRPFDLSELWT